MPVLTRRFLAGALSVFADVGSDEDAIWDLESEYFEIILGDSFLVDLVEQAPGLGAPSDVHQMLSDLLVATQAGFAHFQETGYPLNESLMPHIRRITEICRMLALHPWVKDEIASLPPTPDISPELQSILGRGRTPTKRGTPASVDVLQPVKNLSTYTLVLEEVPPEGDTSSVPPRSFVQPGYRIVDVTVPDDCRHVSAVSTMPTIHEQ